MSESESGSECGCMVQFFVCVLIYSYFIVDAVVVGSCLFTLFSSSVFLFLP